MDHQTRSITQKVYVPAKPIDVYNSLVDPVLHGEVTGARVRGEAKIGGRFTALNEYISGKYLDLDEGKRILMEWQANKWPPEAAPSIVEMTLKEKGSGTEIKLLQTMIPTEELEACRSWWDDFYWNAVLAYFNK